MESVYLLLSYWIEGKRTLIFMTTLILTLALVFQSPNLVPISETPIDDLPDAQESEGVKHYSDSATVAAYWKQVYRNEEEVKVKMKQFNTQEYNYIRLVYVANCNTRVNYSLEKDQADKQLKFRYTLFEMGASPCRGADFTVKWLRYPKQKNYVFTDAS